MFRPLISVLFAFSLAATAALAAAPMKGMDLPPQPKVRPAGIPSGFMMVSPCVQAMGEHWANLKSKSAMTGPIYGTYQGKPVFSEIMITREQLQKGFNYSNLTALPGHTIDHVDMNFEPHGHPGMPFPHYDLHAYYVSAAEQAKICPNGVPDPRTKSAM